MAIKDLFHSPELDINVEEKTDQELFTEALVDIGSQVPAPPIALSIGTDYEVSPPRPLIFGTYGNISLIKGEEKSRKSFAKSLLLACALGGKANNYSEEVRSHNLAGRYVVEVDTEQDPYYVSLNTNRVVQMVGAKPPNYIALQLRPYTFTQRMGVLRYLFERSPIKDQLGLVFIDGYVDLLRDFNSQEESNALTNTLMGWSSRAGCHISGILHLNPGSEKGRGHLGTILQQKCETVAIVRKEGPYSILECQRGRGKSFDPLAFAVNKSYQPYQVDMSEVIMQP